MHTVFPMSTIRQKLHEKNGYGQSKFIAETIVAAAAMAHQDQSPGNRLGVLNPVLIIGGPNNNHTANLDDLLWRIIGACVLMGEYYPKPEEWIHVARAEDVAHMAVDALIEPMNPPEHT